MELWKPIPNYIGLYEASDQGNIRSLVSNGYCRGGLVSRKEPFLMKPTVRQDGYAQVKLRGQRLYVHRLILLTFVGPVSKEMEANHIDRKRSNNKLSNLEWILGSNNKPKKSKLRLESFLSKITGG